MKNITIYSKLRDRVLKLLAAILLLVVLAGCGTDSGNPDVPENNVIIRSISPQSPSSLVFKENVTITYDYEIDDPDGVRIWVMPYTNGSISPKYRYTSSPLFTGKGSRTVHISITSGETTVVDQLKIKIVTADQSETLSESFEEVNYTFSN